MQQIRTETTSLAQPSASIADPCVSEPSFVEALIDPAAVFRHPCEAAEHPRFTDQEKRTVLLSWARDELVLEQVASRTLPELRPRSRIDAVIEALDRFDPRAAGEYRSAVARIRAGTADSRWEHRWVHSRGAGP